MKDISLLSEELDFFGAAFAGRILSDAEINFLKKDLLVKKEEDIRVNGEETLLKYDYETIRDLARYGDEYFDLIENVYLNELVNALLNEKAVVHSYNAIINFPGKKSNMVGFDFHRDQPYFGDVRTSIIVMIPLVDFSSVNGATEYLPCSHSFKDIPSKTFQQKHFLATQGKAGEAYIIDASTWHRAGVNSSLDPRPMITIKYTLAPFKQQIDFCKSAEKVFHGASNLVKQRLGWDVRVCESYEEFRVPGEKRKFKSGQYDMSNVYINRN